VIVAIGQNASAVREAMDGYVEMDKYGGIKTADDLSTPTPGIYAAGDIVLGPSSIIEAVGQAKKAAASIHRFLMGIKDVAPATKETAAEPSSA
jgi:glutamate synthase (NADPH/NADH) small chain